MDRPVGCQGRCPARRPGANLPVGHQQVADDVVVVGKAWDRTSGTGRRVLAHYQEGLNNRNQGRQDDVALG